MWIATSHSPEPLTGTSSPSCMASWWRVPVLYLPKPTMPCSTPSPEDSKSDSKHLTDNTLCLPYNLKCSSFTLSCLVIVTLLRLIFYFLYKIN